MRQSSLRREWGGLCDVPGGRPLQGADPVLAMLKIGAPVAQLDRALASGARGYGFDPRRARVFTCVWRVRFFKTVSSSE